MSRRSLWYKLIALVLASVLIVPILAACGKEKEKTPVPTPTLTANPSPTLTATSGPTPTATLTPTVKPTPTPTRPVKIGAIMPWSGPLTVSGLLGDQIIAIVQDQLQNMGGILGGREVEFVRGDMGGTTAGAVGQAEKLILEDKVDILIWGGVSGAQFTAVADVAEELKVPYVAMAAVRGIQHAKYTACLYGIQTVINRVCAFTINFVKPKTVAFLGYDDEDIRILYDGYEPEGIPGCRELLKAAGIDIVYAEFYPLTTVDFSPHLTKIKYLNPDLFIGVYNNQGVAISVLKQISELGGWGSIKYFCALEVGFNKTCLKMPSAVGTYAAVLWLPGSDEPGMKAFEDAFVQRYGGKIPAAELTYYYNSVWVAIKAIELAGTTDHDKVAEALRSGNLELDSAWGPLRIGTDGIGKTSAMVVQIQEGGKGEKVWSWSEE